MDIVEPAPTVRPLGGRAVRRMCVYTVLCFVAALLLVWPQHGHLLDWDEVDYVGAANAGILRNMVDAGSVSPAEFVRLVTAKVTRRPHLAPPSYEERSDPFVLRHYHPPGVPMLMGALPSNGSERSARIVQVLGLASLVSIVMVSYRRTSPRPTTAGLLSLGLTLVWVCWHLFSSVQFHGWEAVFVTAVGLSLLEWTRGGQRRWAIALCGTLAMAILTLESGVVLVAVAAVYTSYSARRGQLHVLRGGYRRTLGVGLGCVFAFVIAGWPASIIKADFIRTPVCLLSLLPGGTFASTGAGAGSWAVRVPVCLGAATIIYLIRFRRDEIADWGPWATVALYSLPLIPIAVAPRYVLAGLIPLFIAGAYALDTLPRRPRASLTAGLVVVTALGLGVIVRDNGRTGQTDRLSRADMSFLEEKLDGVPSLVDGGHVFRHYLRSFEIEDLWFSDDFSLLGVRRRAKFQRLRPDEIAGRYVVVLRRREGFLHSAAARDVVTRCPVLARPTVWLFDCTASRPAVERFPP